MLTPIAQKLVTAAVVAQAPVPTPTPDNVGGIAAILEAAGPFGLAAVLIVGLIQLWKKLGKREEELGDARDKFVEVVERQTVAIVESTTVLRSVQDGLQRVEDKVAECPDRDAGR